MYRTLKRTQELEALNKYLVATAVNGASLRRACSQRTLVVSPVHNHILRKTKSSDDCSMMHDVKYESSRHSSETTCDDVSCKSDFLYDDVITDEFDDAISLDDVELAFSTDLVTSQHRTVSKETSVIFPDEMRCYYDFTTACSDVTKHGIKITNTATYPNCDSQSYSPTATSLRHHLQQCYVYIHGGKDVSGSPVICFPHFPGLHDVSTEGFKDTLYYLTHTTRASVADLGFVVILDRRKDKWSSLKATLVRLAENFPGNIRIVLVLKPLGFLQGAITNFGFRWQKDEFAMKVPVVLLSSLDDLSRYVLPTELTNHFGGTFQYDHITWINNRMLVETFSAKATSAILALEEYGSQLAESELPNDSKSAVVLINTQQIRTNTQKDGIEILRKEAALLRNEISILNNNDVNAVEAGLMECYETLISETDVTFDNFWLKYKEKMKQCLQLRLFEEDYRDVCAKLETVRQQIESKYLNVGITFPWLEAFISGLSDLEQSTNECLEVCGKVQQHGCDLVAAGHYAVDCIQPKTDELQNQSCEIKEQITELQCSLKSYQNFINQLNEVRQWCEDGMAFLAGQVLETSLTVDGANSALNELETKFEKKEQNVQILVGNSVVQSQCGRLWSAEAEELSCHVKSRLTEVTLLYEKRRSSLKKAATKHGERPVQLVEPSKKMVTTTKGSKRDPPRDGKEQVITKVEENQSVQLPTIHSNVQQPKVDRSSENFTQKQQHVMKELVSTEKTYISELKSIVEGYGRPMDDPTHPGVPATLLGKSKELLGNMDEIYDFHSSVFLGLLEECVDNPSSVGRCFLSKKENFEIYSKYCQNSIKSEQLRRLVGEQHPFFMQCQQKLGHRLSLSAFLLKPVQRVTKYQLLLQQMLKYSNSHLKELQTALDAMLGILKSVNDGMHQVMITGYQDDLTLLGKLHLQSQFTMQVDHKKSRVKSLKRPRFSKAIQRHLFLYDDEILICKPQTMESLDDNDNHFKSNNQSVASVVKNKGLQYLYKNSIKMENAGMLDTIKSDPRKFEVWSEGREHVYTLQAPTIITKQEWIKGLKSILMNKSNNTHSNGVTTRKPSSTPAVAYVRPKTAEPEVKTTKLKTKRSTSLSVTDIKVECSAPNFKQLSIDH